MKLRRDFKDFVEEHRSNPDKSKIWILDSGEVGFRLSTSVSIPKVKEKAMETIRHPKARQVTDYIIVEERVSKDALKKHGEDAVSAVGTVWKQKDVFSCEAYSEKLERTL